MTPGKFYDMQEAFAFARFLLKLSKISFELRLVLLEEEDWSKVDELGKSLVSFMMETSNFMKDYGLASIPEPEPRGGFENPFGEYGDVRVILVDPKLVVQDKIPLIRGIRNATGFGLGMAKKVADDALYGTYPTLCCFFGPNAQEHAKLAARTIELSLNHAVKLQKRDERDSKWQDFPAEEP